MEHHILIIMLLCELLCEPLYDEKCHLTCILIHYFLGYIYNDFLGGQLSFCEQQMHKKHF